MRPRTAGHLLRLLTRRRSRQSLLHMLGLSKQKQKRERPFN